MRVAGIDPSKSGFGWCVGSDKADEQIRYGCQSFSHRPDDEGPMLTEIRRLTLRLIEHHGAERIYCEKPVKVPTDDLTLGFLTLGIPAVIFQACHERGIPFAWVPIDTWRNWFIGTCRVKAIGLTTRDAKSRWYKEQAMLAAADRGYLTDNHNTAEAIGIWDFALASASRAHWARSAPKSRAWQHKWAKRPRE